jgi:hypothetical protein
MRMPPPHTHTVASVCTAYAAYAVACGPHTHTLSGVFLLAAGWQGIYAYATAYAAYAVACGLGGPHAIAYAAHAVLLSLTRIFRYRLPYGSLRMLRIRSACDACYRLRVYSAYPYCNAAKKLNPH